MVRNPLDKRYKRQIKNDFAKYLVIFLMLTLMISLTTGFEVANTSVVKRIEDNKTLYNQQDGYFNVKKKLNNSQIKLIEDNEVSLYEEFYIDEDFNEGTLRVFKIRDKIDLQEVIEGRLAESSDEINLDRLYATNNNININDQITINNKEYTVVGYTAIVDYLCLYENQSDMMFNARSFGTALVTNDGFNNLNKGNITYHYAYKYNESFSEDIRRDKDDDLKDIIIENSEIKEFVPEYSNKSIAFVVEDCQSDGASMYVFQYLSMIMCAYIFAITISNTIQKESTVIGTLKASGYTDNELIKHYMVMPISVTLLASVVGNILGYTLIESYMIEVYKMNYSLSKYISYFNINVFILSTVFSILIMLVLNYLILRKKLTLSPLKFMRHDLSKHKQRKALNLSHKIKFFNRYRIRIIIQNKAAYITLIIGILFANLLLFFGLAFPSAMNDFVIVSRESIVAPYETILNMPLSLTKADHKLEASVNLINFANKVETKNETAEKFSFYETEYLPNNDYKSDDVNIYGFKENSNYFKHQLKSDDCYISYAFSDKYNLNVGDYFTLNEPYGSDTYTFKITGIYDNNASLEVYLNMDTLNEIFDLGSGTFVGYLTSIPITDIDSEYISQTITADTLAIISTQLMSSMGEMIDMFAYFAIGMFVIVIYLLSKLIIERNSNNISMSKILGYSTIEIGKLYVISTTLVVLFASIISIPFCYGPLLVLFNKILYTEMNGYFPFILNKEIAIKMFVYNMSVYAIVALFELRRINKVPMDEALKNVV